MVPGGGGTGSLDPASCEGIAGKSLALTQTDVWLEEGARKPSTLFVTDPSRQDTTESIRLPIPNVAFVAVDLHCGGDFSDADVSRDGVRRDRVAGPRGGRALVASSMPFVPLPKPGQDSNSACLYGIDSSDHALVDDERGGAGEVPLPPPHSARPDGRLGNGGLLESVACRGGSQASAAFTQTLNQT